jgi:molecular chaperone DnaK (HSP70)
LLNIDVQTHGICQSPADGDADANTFAAGAKHLSMTITRGKFEQLTDGLLNRTRQPCKDCLKDAGISQSEVTEVLLVGGMTRMPKASC